MPRHPRDRAGQASASNQTSNTFQDRPATGQPWINQKVEEAPSDVIRDPNTSDYFYGHSSPISWCALTILPLNLPQPYLIANNLGFVNSLAVRNASPNDAFSTAENLDSASSGARVWFSYRATGQFMEPNPGLKSVWGKWTRACRWHRHLQHAQQQLLHLALVLNRQLRQRAHPHCHRQCRWQRPRAGRHHLSCDEGHRLSNWRGWTHRR